MLLGNADIKQALGIGLGELVEPGARRHRRSDRANCFVARGLGHQRKEQIAVVLDIERADDADPPWRLAWSDPGLPGFVNLSPEGFSLPSHS